MNASSKPEARPKTVAACVPPQPAHTPQKFVTLHQIEIVPTGPDPRRDPKFLAMHGSSRQRQRRERPRWQPYSTSVQRPQRPSATGRGIQTRPDASDQQFQPSLASMSQSRSLSSTGVMNEGFHTSHRTQPQHIFGPQHQPQQRQVVDTNVGLSPYGGHVSQLPDMARLDPSAGWRNEVPTTLGEFALRQLAEGQFAQGPPIQTQFAQGQPIQAQFAQGQPTLGEFALRQLAQGQLAQGQFTLGEFAQRQLAQGQFTPEQFNQG